jgi:hypothetical protein
LEAYKPWEVLAASAYVVQFETTPTSFVKQMVWENRAFPNASFSLGSFSKPCMDNGLACPPLLAPLWPLSTLQEGTEPRRISYSNVDIKEWLDLEYCDTSQWNNQTTVEDWWYSITGIMDSSLNGYHICYCSPLGKSGMKERYGFCEAFLPCHSL